MVFMLSPIWHIIQSEIKQLAGEGCLNLDETTPTRAIISQGFYQVGI